MPKSNNQVEKKEKEHYVPKSWEEVSTNLYQRIEWYASKFITYSVYGVVVGVIGVVYGFVSLALGSAASQISTFLGLFIGFGALVASIILLLWGVFWRRRVENQKIL